MEAQQALTNRSEPHRRVCGAGRTKDLTDSKEEGGSLRFQTGRDFLLKGEARRREGVLDFPPDEDRPGGHIGEEDPIAGFFTLNR